jgi:hypothetical protein
MLILLLHKVNAEMGMRWRFGRFKSRPKNEFYAGDSGSENSS